MSEQELNLRKYVIKIYIEELLRKLETKKNIINDASNYELNKIVDEIYNDIDIFKDETINLKAEKIK